MAARPTPVIVSTGDGRVDLHQIAAIDIREEKDIHDSTTYVVVISLINGGAAREEHSGYSDARECRDALSLQWENLYKKQ